MSEPLKGHAVPPIAERVDAYLDAHRIAYEALTDVSDVVEAGAAHRAAADDAVAVTAWVLAIGERYALLVLPRDEPPAIGLLNQRAGRAGGRRVRLASETEIEQLFPDCDHDAVPPCGEPYGVPVYVSDELADERAFVCAGGRVGAWVRVDQAGFERLARPVWLTLPPAGPGLLLC